MGFRSLSFGMQTFFSILWGVSRGLTLVVSRRCASNTYDGLDVPMDSSHELTLIAAITSLLYAACKD